MKRDQTEALMIAALVLCTVVQGVVTLWITFRP